MKHAHKILIAAGAIILLMPVLSFAIEYQTLAPIQGYVGETVGISGGTWGPYLNSMFKLGIALCTGLAVLMIIIGGLQYASSDAWSKKNDGKERIMAAIFGLLIALGSWVLLNTINPQLLDTSLTLQAVRMDGIPTNGSQVPDYVPGNTVKDQYTRTYEKWTDTDDAALQDPNSAGNQAALDKWNGIQSEIDELNDKNGPQVNPATANVGAANQKVLAEINKGTSCSTSAHCYAGAVALGNAAGVNFNSVYQGSAYVVGGRTLNSFGSARMPVPGEMVDYRFYEDNREDPFHSVIVYSDEGNGKYTVWDWKHSTVTGLRTVNLNLNNPGTKGYIGRIYVPQNK